MSDKEMITSHTMLSFLGLNSARHEGKHVLNLGAKGDGAILASQGGLQDSDTRLAVERSVVKIGGPGDDCLAGGGGRDLLIGGFGDDKLDGRAGNDLLLGGFGDDVLLGGEGDDLLLGGPGDDVVDGGAGDDVAILGRGRHTLRYESFDGSDTIFVARESRSFDVLAFGAGILANDVAFARSGLDLTISLASKHGGGGVTVSNFFAARPRRIDQITFDDGAEVLDVSDFTDISQFPTSDDIIIGDDGDNTLSGGVGNDTIDGGEGNDTIDGGDGDDALFGGPGEDDLKGGDGDDFLEGGDGDDTLDGGAGNDRLVGDSGIGDDLLIGGPGDDSLEGGAGDDTLIGGAGDDVLDGGEGTDRVDYSSDALAGGTAGVTVNLATGKATDGFGDSDTLVGIELVRGSNAADTLIGSDLNSEFAERFRGLAGADFIDGGLGFEEVDYASDADFGGTAGVTVDLAAGTATDGFGDRDTLIGIELVRGTNATDLLLGGNPSADDFENFRPLGGEDLVDGGSGFDQIDYATDADFGGMAGVTVDFSAGTAIDPFGDSDSIANIERVRGTNQADLLVGGNPNADNFEAFRPLGGDDFVDGGSGFDQIDYITDANFGGTAGVVVDLAAGTATDGFGDNDRFVDIEGVRGTNAADQLLGGNPNADNFESYRPLGGNDFVDGGSGFDEIDYITDANFGGTAGVTVDLAAGTATDGFGDSDTFINIEAVRGTNAADMLFGGNPESDDFENFLPAGGDDHIDGGRGFDEVDYSRDDSFGGMGGVTFSFITGTATDPFGDSDTFVNVERVRGSNQSDVLIGGNPSLDGFEGFRGVGGDDFIDGGSDFDEVDYISDAGAGGSAGVSVDLAAGTATDGFGDTDRLLNVEAVRATNQGDILLGGNPANDGFERFRPMGGDDFVDGGRGFDEIDYSREVAFGGTAGVIVNLATGTATDSFGGTDTIRNVEAVQGSDLDDLLIGGDGNDTLDGDDGDDTLQGGLGDDVLEGDSGFDSIDGGGGIDTVLYVQEGRSRVDLSTGEARVRAESEISLDVLDPVTGQVLQSVGLDNFFDGLGARDDGAGAFTLFATEGGSDQIFLIDPLTGAESFLGNTGVGWTSDLDFVGTTMLGGVGRGSPINPGAVLAVDQIDGGGTFLADPVTPGGISGLAVDPVSGRIFASTIVEASGGTSAFPRTSQLVELNPDGTLLAVIGDITDTLSNPIAVGDLAFQPGTGVLFAVKAGANEATLGIPPATAELLTVDLESAVATSVGTITDGVNDRSFSQSIAFAPDGTLYHAGQTNIFEIDTLVDIENIVGSPSRDILIGDDNDNRIEGNGGSSNRFGGDQVFGRGGDDVLIGAEGDDVLDGGAGTDTARFSGRSDDFTILRNPDGSLSVTDINPADGDLGSDTLIAVELLGFGDAFVPENSIFGTPGSDTLDGTAGDDTILGQRGNDILNGLDGDDFLFGGSGNDNLLGGADSDRLLGAEGDDLLNGGAGFDAVDYGPASGGVTVDLAIQGVGNPQPIGADQGNDTLISIEGVFASFFDDVLIGDGQDNFLSGIAGNDTISGGSGSDTLSGDEGDDLLTGGLGNDTFLFRDGDGDDRIEDFAAGAGPGDLIDLRGVSALGDFAAVEAAATAVGGDTLIGYGGGSVLLVGIAPSELKQDDFLF